MLTTCCPACETTFRVVPDQLKLADGWVRCGRCSRVFDAFEQMGSGAQAAGALEVEAMSAPVPVPAPAPAVAPAPVPVADDQPAEPVSEDQPVTEPARPAGSVMAAATQPRGPAWLRGVAWGLAILLAAVGLMVQVALHERDRLAALEPRSVPVLQQLCDWLGCELSALRRTDAIVVDGSDLITLNEGGYRLQFALSNPSDTDVAMPAIELTLSNAADQPMVRRVILPADLGAPAVLPARGQWNGQATFTLTEGMPPVAGYRVLAFYP